MEELFRRVFEAAERRRRSAPTWGAALGLDPHGPGLHGLVRIRLNHPVWPHEWLSERELFARLVREERLVDDGPRESVARQAAGAAMALVNWFGTVSVACGDGGLDPARRETALPTEADVGRIAAELLAAAGDADTCVRAAGDAALAGLAGWSTTRRPAPADRYGWGCKTADAEHAIRAMVRDLTEVGMDDVGRNVTGFGDRARPDNRELADRFHAAFLLLDGRGCRCSEGVVLRPQDAGRADAYSNPDAPPPPRAFSAAVSRVVACRRGHTLPGYRLDNGSLAEYLERAYLGGPRMRDGHPVPRFHFRGGGFHSGVLYRTLAEWIPDLALVSLLSRKCPAGHGYATAPACPACGAPLAGAEPEPPGRPVRGYLVLTEQPDPPALVCRDVRKCNHDDCRGREDQAGVSYLGPRCPACARERLRKQGPQTSEVWEWVRPDPPPWEGRVGDVEPAGDGLFPGWLADQRRTETTPLARAVLALLEAALRDDDAGRWGWLLATRMPPRWDELYDTLRLGHDDRTGRPAFEAEGRVLRERLARSFEAAYLRHHPGPAAPEGGGL